MIGSPLDLSLVIDPAGVPGVRPGINLQVFPSGDSIGDFGPVGTQAERLASGSLSSGGFKQLYEFSTSFYLNGEDFDKLYSLMAFNQNARELGRPWEIVIYNLVRPFSEIRASRSRFKVPGTDVIRSVTFGSGLMEFTYWVCVQGSMVMNWQQEGSFYNCAISFQEGTFLGSELET
jgi:hypothetical protein